jgi:hypothetical protein
MKQNLLTQLLNLARSGEQVSLVPSDKPSTRLRYLKLYFLVLVHGEICILGHPLAAIVKPVMLNEQKPFHPP